MPGNCSRRNMLKLAGAAAITPAVVGYTTEESFAKSTEWPPVVGPDVPKICLSLSSNANESQVRRVKQLGITHVMGRAGRTEEEMRESIERLQKQGLTRASSIPNTHAVWMLTVNSPILDLTIPVGADTWGMFTMSRTHGPCYRQHFQDEVTVFRSEETAVTK